MNTYKKHENDQLRQLQSCRVVLKTWLNHRYLWVKPGLVYSRYREALTKELPCLGIEEIADYDVGTMKENVKSEKA